MNIDNMILCFGILLFIMFAVMLLDVPYSLGENGRWIRDHSTSSSKITDNETMSIWCDIWATDEGYVIQDYKNNVEWKKEKGQQYCGNISVDMYCIFTNSGDHCSIKEVSGQ